MTQQFTTTDVLRLEVVADPVPSVLVATNRATNPGANTVTTGWNTNDATKYPVTLETGVDRISGAGCARTIRAGTLNNVAGSIYATGVGTASSLAVTPGETFAMSVDVKGQQANREISSYIQYRKADNSALSQSPVTVVPLPAGVVTRVQIIHTVPALAAWAFLVVTVRTTNASNALTGETVWYDNLLVGPSGPYFDGDTADTGDYYYAWTGTANASTSTQRTQFSLPNLVPNPSGELGGWGWLTPVPNTSLGALPEPAPPLEFRTTAAQAAYVLTEPIPVSGDSVKGSLHLIYTSAPTVGLAARFVFYDASLAVISSGAQTAIYTTNSGITIPTMTVPTGTEFVALRFDMYRSGGNPSAYDYVTFDSVALVHGLATDLDSGTIILDPGWVDVLGPTHEIKVSREALNVGTLTATILDADLDPSQATTIRPGHPVRLSALSADSGDFESLFIGRVSNGQVTYELKDPSIPDEKRARITLTALDNIQPLAQARRSEGVQNVADLPYVLEGAGVPWNVDGETGQIAQTPTVVAKNDNASALDQVAITRDTSLGYGWVDRRGVLQVHQLSTLNATVQATLGEAAYSGLDVDYNTDDCINTVTLKYLRLNPTTGETEEISYGPYVDAESVRLWGPRAAEFTIQGVAEETSNLAAYAASILAANATPVVRINSVTVPIVSTADLGTSRALLDLYDLVTVSNARAGLTEQSRITGIEHTITPDKWLTKVAFSVNGSVASPQFIPSPSPGAGGKTIGQLLRPVGEITMFGGSTIPAGWLKCDGSTFSSVTYPDLAALLGDTFGTHSGTTYYLPNFNDRFPIGAGTKALGTSGGGPTKPIPAHSHQIAGHDHTVPAANMGTAANTTTTGTATRLTSGETHNHGGVTGSSGILTTAVGGAGSDFDVMNPWRAIWFIIRAT